MVRDYDSSAPIGTERVIVCITAQSNSERLIDAAAKIADEENAEFHILNVNKGTSIFNNAETPQLLEKLFEYGSRKGGMVHMKCSENVPESIGSFIKEYKITSIVLGEPPAEAEKIPGQSEFGGIKKILDSSGAKIRIVEREN